MCKPILGQDSAANVLLHELGHSYYELFDPLGKIAEEKEATLNMTQEEEDAFYAEWEKGYGEYDNYADKWLIENVETEFKGEWKRESHHEGYFLHTKGGSFSTRGKEAGISGKTLKVKEIKDGGSIERSTEQ